MPSTSLPPNSTFIWFCLPVFVGCGGFFLGCQSNRKIAILFFVGQACGEMPMHVHCSCTYSRFPTLSSSSWRICLQRLPSRTCGMMPKWLRCCSICTATGIYLFLMTLRASFHLRYGPGPRCPDRTEIHHFEWYNGQDPGDMLQYTIFQS